MSKKMTEGKNQTQIFTSVLYKIYTFPCDPRKSMCCVWQIKQINASHFSWKPIVCVALKL